MNRVGPGELAAMVLWAAFILFILYGVLNLWRAWSWKPPLGTHDDGLVTAYELREMLGWDDDSALPSRIDVKNGAWVRSAGGNYYGFVACDD